MHRLKNVLIVDDSAQMHFMYKMVLMRYKCNILDAMNGQEAFYTLTKNPDVGLIILDINMPLMSGLEFIRTVKQREDYKQIPIIIASTAGKEEDTITGLALGAQGSVKKPFTSRELRGLIEKIYPHITEQSPRMNAFSPWHGGEYSYNMLVRKKRLMQLSKDIY